MVSGPEKPAQEPEKKQPKSLKKPAAEPEKTSLEQARDPLGNRAKNGAKNLKKAAQ